MVGFTPTTISHRREQASSFFGEFTRVEIGHMRIRSAENGRSRSRGRRARWQLLAGIGKSINLRSAPTKASLMVGSTSC